MKILIVGDIIGSPGRTYIKENLTSIKNKYNVDFTIVNGENASAGVGLDPKCAHELFDAGVDAITLGNHTWRKKDIIKILDDPRIIRPANYQKSVPGKGSRVISFNNKKIGIINAVGRVYMDRWIFFSNIAHILLLLFLTAACQYKQGCRHPHRECVRLQNYWHHLPKIPQGQPDPLSFPSGLQGSWIQ